MQISNSTFGPINNQNNGFGSFFDTIYNKNITQAQKSKESKESKEVAQSELPDINSQDIPINIRYDIQDRFLPSKEYEKAKEIGGQIEGGFRDVKKFDEMRDVLLNASILDPKDMISMAKFRTSEKLSFDAFDKIASNDAHTKEMRDLLNTTIHKLKNVDAINGGILENYKI